MSKDAHLCNSSVHRFYSERFDAFWVEKWQIYLATSRALINLIFTDLYASPSTEIILVIPLTCCWVAVGQLPLHSSQWPAGPPDWLGLHPATINITSNNKASFKKNRYNSLTHEWMGCGDASQRMEKEQGFAASMLGQGCIAQCTYMKTT
jgi:hypothetical protein